MSTQVFPEPRFIETDDEAKKVADKLRDLAERLRDIRREFLALGRTHEDDHVRVCAAEMADGIEDTLHDASIDAIANTFEAAWNRCRVGDHFPTKFKEVSELHAPTIEGVGRFHKLAGELD